MVHPFTYCLIQGRAFSHKYLCCTFLVISSLPRCPPPLPSCQTRMTFFLISSIGGTMRRPKGSCRQTGPSTCSSLIMGRSSAHLSMTSLTVHWVSTIWCSRDPLESALNTFKNNLGGSSAISRESSTMSAPGGLDSVSASVFVFPTMWTILKS